MGRWWKRWEEGSGVVEGGRALTYAAFFLLFVFLLLFFLFFVFSFLVRVGWSLWELEKAVEGWSSILVRVVLLLD